MEVVMKLRELRRFRHEYLSKLGELSCSRHEYLSGLPFPVVARAVAMEGGLVQPSPRKVYWFVSNGTGTLNSRYSIRVLPCPENDPDANVAVLVGRDDMPGDTTIRGIVSPAFEMQNVFCIGYGLLGDDTVRFLQVGDTF